MPQKSKLTLCVSNPQATVWNSSGLESLRNFPQPYNVSQSTMRNRLLRARNRILLLRSALSLVADKKKKKSQKATTIYGLWWLRGTISCCATGDHSASESHNELKEAQAVSLLMCYQCSVLRRPTIGRYLVCSVWIQSQNTHCLPGDAGILQIYTHTLLQWQV